MNDNELNQYLATYVKTFDLIGFRGREFVSKLIVHMEKKAIKNKDIHIDPKISHVGIVVEGKDLQEYHDCSLHSAIDVNKIYIFESTATGRIIDKVKDVYGKYFFGAQLRDLKKVISSYKGCVFHSSKLFPVTREQVKLFVEFVQEYNHRPYEKSCRSLFGNICRCIEIRENTDSVFCSELVSLALINSGVLANTVNPELVVPLDFYPDPINIGRTLDVDGEIPLIYSDPVAMK